MPDESITRVTIAFSTIAIASVPTRIRLPAAVTVL